MGVKVFTSRIIRTGLGEAELQRVVAKFRAYKESGDPQDFFGRDATFDRPQGVVSAGLQHVHLNEGRPWGVRLLQYGRKSDMHLVYCQGFFREDHYLVITLLKGAHAKYRDDLFMLGLADIASAFRDKF